MIRMILFLLVSSLCAAEAAPKNIILMIGDGMGYNQIQAASLYTHGAYNAQEYWAYYNGPVATWSQSNPEQYDPALAWESFEYFRLGATDSAAAATTLASGVKTTNGAIGVNAEGKALESILDVAKARGKAAGVLSTVYLSHATPAAFVAHDASRSNVAEIARQMIEERPVDLIMAPGHPWFDDDGKQVGGFDPDPMQTAKSYNYVGGEETWQRLRQGVAGGDANGDGTPDPWTLVDDAEALKALQHGETPKRVLGLVPVHSTLRANRSGDMDAAPHEVPVHESLPDMADLMRSALNVLNQHPNGFFLMAEGGAIDWAGHANKMGRLIEEQADFDAAVSAVFEWVDQHSSWDDTLVIITADHETGYLMGPDSDPAFTPLENLGKGEVPGHVWHSGSHTNQLVPLFVRGAGAEQFRLQQRGVDPRRGPYIDNGDIGSIMKQFWR